MSIKALLIDLSLPMKDENAHLLQALSKWLQGYTQQDVSPQTLQQQISLTYSSEIQQRTTVIYDRITALLASTLDGDLAPLERFGEVYRDSLEQQLDDYLSHPQVQELLSSIPSVLIAVNPILPFHPKNLRNHPIVYIGDGKNSHYLKPSVYYYAEILARSTLEPDEVLMVCYDSLSLEVFNQLGIATWNMLNPKQWEESTDMNLHPDGVLAQLEANVSALYGLLSHVEYGEWHRTLIPNEWTIAQNIAHLVEKEMFNYRPLILKVLQDADAFITEHATSLHPPIDSFYQVNPLALVDHFLLERRVSMGLLHTLDDELWGRTFQHSVFGTTTLIEMVYFIAQHDRMHLRQICQLLQICM